MTQKQRLNISIAALAFAFSTGNTSFAEDPTVGPIGSEKRFVYSGKASDHLPYDTDIPNSSQRENLKMFKPRFFASKESGGSDLSLEVVEQGHLEHSWSTQSLMSGGEELSNLLTEAGLSWERINALHVSHLNVDISKSLVRNGPLGQTLLVPIFYSIGLEVIRPADGETARLTMEVRAMLAVDFSDAKFEVRIEAYNDSNAIESVGRLSLLEERGAAIDLMRRNLEKSNPELSNDSNARIFLESFYNHTAQKAKPFKGIEKFFDGRFARLVNQRVLSVFLLGETAYSQAAWINLPANDRVILNRGRATLIEIVKASTAGGSLDQSLRLQ